MASHLDSKKWKLSWVMSKRMIYLQNNLLRLKVVKTLNNDYQKSVQIQINLIITPIIRSLNSLKIFGRLTRKERAALIIRKFRRVTLAKKSADIEHASQSKALRFGMSGVSAWFMLKDEGAKPMAYNFSMSFFPYVTRGPKNLELPRIKHKLYLFVRNGSSGSKIPKGELGKIAKKELPNSNFRLTSTIPSTPAASPSSETYIHANPEEIVTAKSEQKTPAFFKHEPKQKSQEKITEEQKSQEEIKKDLQERTSYIKKTVDTCTPAEKLEVSAPIIAAGSRSDLSTIFSRSYASFAVGSRLPTKEPKKPEEIKPDGTIMMSTYDHTNKEKGHQIVVNLDSIDENGFLDVYGVFTSSAKPYHDFYNFLVSKKNYSGQDKKQYVHIYPNCSKLHISAITFSDELWK